ncbi:hypothetical protein WR25_13568 [Diploscapter pachys]|uniref:Uncharacterized protein n=1 Tax=Diploscapter pachys TaxID=2018661 RepID=A0A2A2JCU3_9BILA|nr:hypothetical protein WR25_13568 [Diploscapter pachys]
MASSSHNNSSSVDEAEKHLLGNLLEDDPFSPPRSSPNRNICASSGGETSGPPSSITRANSGAQVVVGQPQSAVPNTSVINGVALGPVGDVGRFWPEPPPPYTASIQSSWTSSALKPTSPSPFGDSTANPLSDFLQAQLFKDTPTNLNDILTSEPAFLRQFAASRQSKFPQTATPQPPAQIHHIHHNFHTHTHNIVENHHHYPLPPHGFAGTPEALFNPSTISAARAVATAANSAHTNRFAHHSTGQNIGTPPNQGSGGKGKGNKSYVNVATAGHQNQQQQRHQSASSVSQALSNQGPPTAACIYNIHYDDPPHSAPVLNKMPFSYRDVAARSDAHTATSGSGSPLQMMKRSRDARQAEQISPIGGSGAISEGESTRPDTKRSSDALSTDNEIHINTIIAAKQLQKDRKVKSENGFQKITTKKGKGIKEKIPLTETNSLPVANDESVMMEAPTRYEVLQKLATSPKVRERKLPARAAIIRSRSNSVSGNADEDETENVPSGNGQRAIAVGLSAAKRMFPVVDKKKPAAAAKKRSGRKRSETPMWDVIAHYITLFAGMMGAMLYGLFNMVFDIAVALWGIVVHYLKMTYTFVLMKLRQCCVSTISGIRNTVYAVVSFRPDQLFDVLFDQPGPFGLEFTIQSTKGSTQTFKNSTSTENSMTYQEKNSLKIS